MARPLLNPWERTTEVDVSAQGPFAVGSVLWRDARGTLHCTLVAKATYELGQGESAPADVPLPIQEDDVHWDDDPSRSVHVPSDLAPFKSAAEVVVVGSAFAPGERPARSVVARVVVGSVDKAVECFPARRFRLDGSIDDASPLVRFSLRFEHAAGGPDNPAGIDLSRGDTRGRRPIPPLLPPGFVLGTPGDHIPIAGLGPIASTWPSRSAGLGPHERAWILRPAASPMPQTLPARAFQAAPPEQWLDRPLAANERIVLESLHTQHPRLVMSLSGLEPRAVIQGARVEVVRLAGDLLFIDTDRKLCTLTFRAAVPVAEGTARLSVVVAGVRLGSELSEAAARELLAGLRVADEATSALPAPPADVVTQTTQIPTAWSAKKPALPFGPGRVDAPSPRAGVSDGALPFRGLGTTLGVAPAARPAARESASPPIATEPAPLGPAPLAPMPPAVPPVVAPPALVQPPVLVQAPLVSSMPPILGQTPLAASAPPVVAPPAIVPVSKVDAAPAAGKASSFDAAFGGAKPAEKPVARTGASSFDAAFGGGGKAAGTKVSSFDAAFGGVRAASDAAATRDRGPDPGPAADAPRPVETAVRLWIVDLLCAEPKLAPRLRGMKRFAPVWAAAPSAKRVPGGVDEPRIEPSVPERDRADVLRVLSYARPDDAAAVRRALADSLEEVVDLEPPVVLVAGELRPAFDEMETLKTTVAVAQPVAGTDKKLLAALAVAQEAIAAPIAPRPDATLGLARQIEQASQALSLPPRYVALEVDRLLLEGRRYRRRPLSGAPRVRADLTLAGTSEAMPVYLPDTVASALPLMAAFPVVAICGVRPREDVIETADEALFVSALGRVLQARGEPVG